MGIRFTFWLLLIVLAASNAVAQSVTEDGAICFFFDEEATIRSHYGTGVIVGYLVVNPLWVGHQAEWLQRWTCTFFWEADAGVVGNCDVWPQQGLPAQFNVAGGSVDVDVQCHLPLAPVGPTVVATVGFHVTAAEPVAIHVVPGEFQADGSDPVPFTWLTHCSWAIMCFTTHMANINAGAPIPNESNSWGALKLMYR